MEITFLLEKDTITAGKVLTFESRYGMPMSGKIEIELKLGYGCVLWSAACNSQGSA